MTYKQAIEFLNTFLNFEQTNRYQYPADFSLDRMRVLLQKLGNPQERYPTFHIAGTKGKGSTCAFLASLLKALGFKVGLYTSPHLIRFEERFQINGQPISEEELAQIVERVKPHVGQEHTFFEVTTACAFLYFAQQTVEAAVIEVGMGGRLDATNVIHPQVAGITPISLDHVPKLGRSVEEIAREKAGILKKDLPVVVASQEKSAKPIFIQATSAQGAKLHWLEEEVRLVSAQMTAEGSRFDLSTPRGSYLDLFIRLMGKHQISNAAMALRMLELWPAAQARWDLNKIKEGLLTTQWAGRCQWIKAEGGAFNVLLDGAQNRSSALTLTQTLADFFYDRKIWLIFGASQDKDIKAMAEVLGPVSYSILATRAQNPRAESPAQIVARFAPWCERILLVDSVAQALDRAKKTVGPRDLVVVTGSLFVVAEALQELTKEKVKSASVSSS